jgi:hypothetical protein
MIRHSTLDISYLDNLKDKAQKNQYQIIHGVNVKMTSQRYKVFQDNLVCVECGIEGAFLAIEKEESSNTKNYHINMYGMKGDDEVLMTKDHILPKSKGGKNIHSNYQTMCSTCNSQKGNGDKTVRELFNQFVYNKTDEDIKIIDKLCIELEVDQKGFWNYYITNLDHFSETEFLTEMLTEFYYYIGELNYDFLSSMNIEVDKFIFYLKYGKITIDKSEYDLNWLQFKKNVLGAKLSIRIKLMENKVFSLYMKETDTDMFTKRELRKIKIDILNKK